VRKIDENRQRDGAGANKVNSLSGVSMVRTIRTAGSEVLHGWRGMVFEWSRYNRGTQVPTCVGGQS
jgi:hypothetical protein